MSYSNEIKQFVIDTYNNFYSIKAIQSILRKRKAWTFLQLQYTDG